MLLSTEVFGDRLNSIGRFKHGKIRISSARKDKRITRQTKQPIGTPRYQVIKMADGTTHRNASPSSLIHIDLNPYIL